MAEEEQAELSHNASLFSLYLSLSLYLYLSLYLFLSISHTHTHTITSSHSFLPRTNELKEKTYLH